jgi:hypothetical protein
LPDAGSVISYGHCRILRSFRRNAVHVRQALDLLRPKRSGCRWTATRTQDARTFKRLSIPSGAHSAPGPRVVAQARGARAIGRRAPDSRPRAGNCSRSRQHRRLGGSGRGADPAGWLDAAAFYDQPTAISLITSSISGAKRPKALALSHGRRRVFCCWTKPRQALGEPVILPPAKNAAAADRKSRGGGDYGNPHHED